MKLISPEERRAHDRMVNIGGLKGLILGTALSLGLFGFAPKYYPRLLKLPWSIKTAIFVVPPAFAASVNGELSSQEFDYEMYSSETSQKRLMEEHQRWEELSTSDKVVETLDRHKFKIVTGLWAASMFGSWHYVNKDPLLTKTQKLVQARMYAQFITVGLLLSTLALSMMEEKVEKGHKKVNFTADDEALEEVLNKK